MHLRTYWSKTLGITPYKQEPYRNMLLNPIFFRNAIFIVWDNRDKWDSYYNLLLLLTLFFGFCPIAVPFVPYCENCNNYVHTFCAKGRLFSQQGGVVDSLPRLSLVIDGGGGSF